MFNEVTNVVTTWGTDNELPSEEEDAVTPIAYNTFNRLSVARCQRSQITSE